MNKYIKKLRVIKTPDWESIKGPYYGIFIDGILFRVHYSYKDAKRTFKDQTTRYKKEWVLNPINNTYTISGYVVQIMLTTDA